MEQVKPKNLYRVWTDEGEEVDTITGLVIDQEIDFGPEKGTFQKEKEEKTIRVGLPPTYRLHDKGLSTDIARNIRNKTGTRFTAAQARQACDLRKWQQKMRAIDGIERSIGKGVSRLILIAQRVNLTEFATEKACQIYRQAVIEGLVRGRPIGEIAAGSIYAVCRKYDIPKTLHEISKASTVKSNTILKREKLLLQELEIKVPYPYSNRLVSKITNQLSKDTKTEEELKQFLAYRGHTEIVGTKIFEGAKKAKISDGKSPIAIAAASVYIGSEISRNGNQYGIARRTIAQIANVTEVTIRNRYRELMKKLDINIKV